MTCTTHQYTRKFTIALLVYALTLSISLMLLKWNPDSPLRVLFALLPMLPAGYLPIVLVRMLGKLDELQRRIQLEALGFAFGGTAVLTFGYGFLQNIGFPPLSWFLIWPIMASLWVIGKTYASWRYR
ncbi:MAG: hypothetical protein AAGF95_29100 [Chloroflexota bacterium]